ncbi:MAG: hypothetical protein ABIF77_06095 [bacterium]
MICTWIVISNGTVVLAQAEEMAVPDSTSGDELTGYPWLDAEATASLLVDVVQNETGLTEADWERLGLLELVARDSATTQASAALSRRGGQAAYRLYCRDGTAGSRLGWVRFSHGPWSGAGRTRLDLENRRQRGGYLAWVQDSVRIRLGGTGLQHGLGLLFAAPGRWRSRSATARLASGGTGAVAYSGTDDPRAVWGIATELHLADWRLTTLWGRPDGRSADEAESIQLIQLSRFLTEGEVSVAAGRRGVAQGISLAFRSQPEWGELRLETACWRQEATKPLASAAAVNLRFVAKRWQLEGQISSACSGQTPFLGQRPAALPAWWGWGWLLRGEIRLDRSSRVQALVGRGVEREPTANGPRSRESHRLELVLVTRLRPGVRLLARVRWQGRGDRGWQQRSPWLPPALYADSSRRLMVMDLERTWPQLRLLVSVRDQGQQEATEIPLGTTSRHLLTCSLVWKANESWRWRFGRGWAWGAPLDLLTVAVPAPGIVTPRHWGGWDSETSLGCECRWRDILWQGGVAFREARLDSDLPDRCEFWGRTGVAW